MTNIATSAVHDALSRAADHLLSAAGPDGIVSKKDFHAKLLTLQGTEANLVNALYRFIKSRDTARSARMTKSDSDSALAHIRTELDRFDLEKNGLSREEAERMPELGRIAFALARELNPAPAPAASAQPASADASDLRGEALAQHLGSLAKELYFDYYGDGGGFDPFHAAANLSQLTPDTFRATLGLKDGPLQQIDKIEPGEACMQWIIASMRDGADLSEPAEAFVKALKANLREISVVLLGPCDDNIVEYPVYIVGIDAAGNLVGVKTVFIRA